MGVEAANRLTSIWEQYIKAGSPDFRRWHFCAGQTDPALNELCGLGLIMKLLGTERGFAWRLTEAGWNRTSSP